MSTRRSRRRQALAAIGAVAVLTLLAACASGGGKTAAAGSGTVDAGSGGSKAKIVLRIPDGGNSGVLAKGKKDGSLAAALAKVDARVEWTGTAGAFAPAAQQLDNDQLDVAQGSITSAIAALAQKNGFQLFAANKPDTVGEGILVKDGSAIKSVQDLAGKKVVVWHGGSSEYLLLRALAKNGVPADRVQRVYLAPKDSAAAFNSGQADAWATWSTFSIAERANAGAHFLVDGGAIESQNYAVWAVRNGFAKEHPEVVKALYQYLHDADLAQAKNPDAYINVQTTNGPEAVSGTEKQLTAANLAAGAPTSVITPADLAVFRDVAKFFADQKVTDGVYDVSKDLFDPALLGGS